MYLTRAELVTETSVFLRARLAVVEYSTIPAQAAEGKLIKSILADRHAAYVKASKSREACRISFENRAYDPDVQFD